MGTGTGADRKCARCGKLIGNNLWSTADGWACWNCSGENPNKVTVSNKKKAMVKVRTEFGLSMPRRSEIVLAGAVAFTEGLHANTRFNNKSNPAENAKGAVAYGNLLADAFAAEFEVEDDRREKEDADRIGTDRANAEWAGAGDGTCIPDDRKGLE